MTDVLKYKIALKGFAKLFKDARPKERHAYIYPIRSSGLTILQARTLGFNVTSRLWQSCLNQSERNKGNFPIKLNYRIMKKEAQFKVLFHYSEE